MSQLKQFIKFRKQDFDLMKQYYPNISFFKKLVYCWKKYQYQKKYNFAHLEFFCLHLGEKREAEVAKLFPRKEQAALYEKVNDPSMWAITKDKYASYKILKEFYKRKVCGYNPSPNSIVKTYYDNYDWKSDALSFIETHTRYIIKPLAEACGNGVKIIEKASSVISDILLSQHIEDYPNGFVLEELIQQHEILANWHPSSVNTMRVNVFNSTSYAGGVDVKFPCFRVGRHGAVVDNAGSGGIIVAIEIKSGEMISAADEEGGLYTEHPETHIPFDSKIPFWNELISKATEVSKAMPKLKIAGLDFALDKDKGWSLVEINVEPYMIYQIATQNGIRDYMESFAKKCDVQLT